MKLALAILFVGAGLTLIYSGLTGEPLTPALREVLAGRDPHGRIGKGDSDNGHGLPKGAGVGGSGTTPDVPPPQQVIPGSPTVPNPNDAGSGGGGGVVLT